MLYNPPLFKYIFQRPPEPLRELPGASRALRYTAILLMPKTAPRSPQRALRRCSFFHPLPQFFPDLWMLPKPVNHNLCVHDITLPVDNRGTEDKYLYCKAARHLWVSMPAPSSIFSISSYEAFFFARTLVTALPKP